MAKKQKKAWSVTKTAGKKRRRGWMKKHEHAELQRMWFAR